jgi:hypothetical protein
VPQPVFVLQVTDPLTFCGFAPFLPFLLTCPFSASIVAVNVTGEPYADGLLLEATDVVVLAWLMAKLLPCVLAELL